MFTLFLFPFQVVPLLLGNLMPVPRSLAPLLMFWISCALHSTNFKIPTKNVVFYCNISLQRFVEHN